ncbi:hypothetical protein AB0D04_31115 [Streptomyces sp. NPDC048483]|uniref:hypothetical protein n=1 Tax=Streptomyces sp. NPDC048483 TaxID=3154927 RepID=UPI00341ED14C
MATRAVHRQARKLLGEEPLAMVWCEVHKAIPKPPRPVHHAAGKQRLKPGRHWLFYVGVVAFFFIFIPMFVLDKAGEKFDRLWGERPARGQRAPQTDRPSAARGHGTDDRDQSARPDNGVFDGDWDLTAGQLLLRWYGSSPNAKRLVMLTPDRIHVAASPRRRLSPTKAHDFQIVTAFAAAEARVVGEPGQPRGFATFRICFADGSWLELGRLAEPGDADLFLQAAGT